MPTSTYVALATTTLGTTASSLTFSSIPTSGYRDLVLVVDCEATASFDVGVRYNGDTGSNYSYVFMRAASGGATSASSTQDRIYLGTTALSTDNRGAYILQVMDYSATDRHKTSLHRTNYNDTAIVGAFAARWANTNAITSLEVFASTSTFKIGSTFSLYGIAS